MNEAGRGDGIGADAAADAVVALQHHDLAALGAEHGGADQGIDAAADDDVVRVTHGGQCSWKGRAAPALCRAYAAARAHGAVQAATSASTRSGEPEPFSIFNGGVIRIAPVGGN